MAEHLQDSELLRALDRELPPRRQARAAAHLDVCDSCQQRAVRIRSTLHDVVMLHRVDHGAVLPSHDDGRRRLECTLHDAAATAAACRTWGAHLSPLRSLGVAALVFAMCAGLVWMRATAEPGHALHPGALPQASLTPGAVSPLTARELCNGVRPSRVVTERVQARLQVLRAYEMEHVPAEAYELDALVTPELGGSTDPANLWPQRYHAPMWTARVKDELERLLPEMVCAEQITLQEAQHAIAGDWIAAYQRYFNTSTPLQAHRGPAEDEDDELVFVSNERRPMQLVTISVAQR